MFTLAIKGETIYENANPTRYSGDTRDAKEV
jgi:hypothetical protein